MLISALELPEYRVELHQSRVELHQSSPVLRSSQNSRKCLTISELRIMVVGYVYLISYDEKIDMLNFKLSYYLYTYLGLQLQMCDCPTYLL